MKSFFVTLSASLLAIAPAVSAHGYLATFNVDGTDYVGTNPNSGKPSTSVVRAIDDPSPRTDLKSDDMGCGANTADLTAAKSAPAKPGSVMTFDWKAADDSNWPHNTGPILTYIANCNGDCTNFDSKQAKWIKIDQIGHEDDGNSDTWVQQEVMDGGTTSTTLPKDIPNGSYLVRHEIIALHRAEAGVPEFYPACAQITVSGGQDGTLDETNAVTFPGTYSLKDPGLSDSPYGKTDKTYQFPGPEVQTKIASGDSSSGSDGASSSDAPTKTASGTTATATTSSGPKATGSEGSADSGSDSEGSSDDGGDDSDCTESDTATSVQPTSAAAATQTLDASGGNDGGNGGSDGVETVTQFVTVYANAAQPTMTKSTSTLTVVETVTVTDSSSVAAQTTAASSGSDSGDYNYRHRVRRSRLFARLDLQKA